MEYINEIIPIKGMRCSKCVSTIEQTLNELEGVEEVSVNLSAKNAHIRYDASKVTKDDLQRELRSIGYELAEEKSVFDKLKEFIKKS